MSSERSTDYGSWSLADLRTELKKRNAKTTGKKAVLVQRLEDYDRLFGPLINDTESVFKIAVPGPDKFKDINSQSSLPALTEDDLKMFCELSEREDMTTSKNMYNEYFLLSCRSAHTDGDWYVTGQCASEMRKNVCYNITIKLKNNNILEAQCECAAGAGPYAQCKHVIVFIYGIIDINMKKAMKLKSSCTSTLQTFHHPTTSYTGNPILAQQLKLKSKDDTLKLLTTYDPRLSPESKEKYNEDFMSLISNMDENSNMGTCEMVMPADKQSMYQDHDYMEKTAEQHFFESMTLNSEELTNLERITRTNIKQWLKERKLRLQSSSFGKICKQKSNKMQLARSLMKDNNIQTLAIKHGRKYEPEAIKKFEEVTGVSTTKCGIIVHPEHQFLGSTPDALVSNNEILEVKCPYTARNQNISPESVPYLYLCEESGELKLYKNHDYYYQIQGQMFCTGRHLANFFIYTLCDYYLVKIEQDEDFVAEMYEQLKSFYDDYYKQLLLNKFLYDRKNY